MKINNRNECPDKGDSLEREEKIIVGGNIESKDLIDTEVLKQMMYFRKAHDIPCQRNQ